MSKKITGDEPAFPHSWYAKTHDPIGLTIRQQIMKDTFAEMVGRVYNPARGNGLDFFEKIAGDAAVAAEALINEFNRD